MNWKKLMLTTTGLLLAAGSPWAARADVLDITLVDATPTVVQSATTTVVGFDASLSNPTTDTVYLNNDSSNTYNPSVTVDDSPFNSWPLSLAPGDSYSALLFNVSLAPNLGPGVYTGIFAIEGGTSSADFSEVAGANFSITVEGLTPTPEPSTLFLFGSGLLASWGFLRRKTNLLR